MPLRFPIINVSPLGGSIKQISNQQWILALGKVPRTTASNSFISFSLILVGLVSEEDEKKEIPLI